MNIIFGLIVFTAMNVWADEKTGDKTDDKTVIEKANEHVAEAAEKIEKAIDADSARYRRANNSYFGLINYSPLDIIIPSKLGVTLGLNRTSDQSWELEYLKGSVSVPFVVDKLGEMTDERLSLIGRFYMGSNSFNISYGLSYNRFKLHLGSEILNRMSGGATPSVDLVDIQSLGLNVGIGNRWTFKQDITLSIDWLSWSQPMIVTKSHTPFLNDPDADPEDRDDVDTAKKWISYLPRLTVLKIQLGMMF